MMNLKILLAFQSLICIAFCVTRKCYECRVATLNNVRSGSKYCEDSYALDRISTTDCEGQCYLNREEMKGGLTVDRGCAPDACDEVMNINDNGYLYHYCCQDDFCNHGPRSNMAAPWTIVLLSAATCMYIYFR